MNKAYYEIEDNFMPIYQTAITLIKNREYIEAFHIIDQAKISVVNTEYDNWNGGTYGYTIYLSISVKLYSSLTAEQVHEIEKIFSDTLNEVIKRDQSNYFMVQISPIFTIVDIDWDSIGGQGGKAILKNNIQTIKSIMISVSTGGNRIQNEDDRYKTINSTIQQDCKKLNIIYNNGYVSLWDWYGKWKSDLPTYQLRREYINNLFEPTLANFDDNDDTRNFEPFIQLDGWDRIQRTIVKIRKDSAIANNEEDFQGVGLLCRDVIISLAQAVYDPLTHGDSDERGIEIGKTDAVRMLGNYIQIELAGGSNDELRSYAKATNKLANLLTHKRNATKQDMLLSINATTALINFIGIIKEKY